MNLTKVSQSIFIRKSVSALLCLAIVVSYAFPLEAAQSLQRRSEMGASNEQTEELGIPSALGTVIEHHQAPGAKTVIYIQDAHDSLEAQENIAKLIHLFVEKNGVQTVFEEGYEGPVPTDQYFGFIQDANIKQEVSHFLLDKLRIGGAEYAHINRTKEFRLLGADNIRLHMESVRSYGKAFEEKRASDRHFRTLCALIRRLADRKLPPKFKKWMRVKAKFDEGRIGLTDYLQGMQKDFPGQFNPAQFASRYPNIDLVLTAQRSKSPEVALRKVEEIKYVDLFKDIEKLESELAKKELRDERQRTIFDYYKKIYLLKRSSALRLMPEEYQVIKETIAHLDTKRFADFVVSETHKSIVLSKAWERYAQSAASFYDKALARDQAVRAVLRDFGGNKSESIAVLVFGGFHKEHIRDTLHDLGFNYWIISPAITSLSIKHQNYYNRLMSEGHHAFEAPLQARWATRPPNVYEIESGTRYVHALAGVLEGSNQNVVSLDTEEFEALLADSGFGAALGGNPYAVEENICRECENELDPAYQVFDSLNGRRDVPQSVLMIGVGRGMSVIELALKYPNLHIVAINKEDGLWDEKRLRDRMLEKGYSETEIQEARARVRVEIADIENRQGRQVYLRNQKFDLVFFEPRVQIYLDDKAQAIADMFNEHVAENGIFGFVVNSIFTSEAAFEESGKGPLSKSERYPDPRSVRLLRRALAPVAEVQHESQLGGNLYFKVKRTEPERLLLPLKWQSNIRRTTPEGLHLVWSIYEEKKLELPSGTTAEKVKFVEKLGSVTDKELIAHNIIPYLEALLEDPDSSVRIHAKQMLQMMEIRLLGQSVVLRTSKRGPPEGKMDEQRSRPDNLVEIPGSAKNKIDLISSFGPISNHDFLISVAIPILEYHARDTDGAVRSHAERILEMVLRREGMTRSPPNPSEVFQGLEQELKTLDESLSSAPPGVMNRIFLIGGEPGAGKTTLGSEFQNYLSAKGRDAVVIHSDAFVDTRYLPIRQIALNVLLRLLRHPIFRNLKRWLILRLFFDMNAVRLFNGTLKRLETGNVSAVLVRAGKGNPVTIKKDTTIILEGSLSKFLFPRLRVTRSVYAEVDRALQKQRIYDRAVQRRGQSRARAQFAARLLSDRTFDEIFAVALEDYDFLLKTAQNGMRTLISRQMTWSKDADRAQENEIRNAQDLAYRIKMDHFYAWADTNFTHDRVGRFAQAASVALERRATALGKDASQLRVAIGFDNNESRMRAMTLARVLTANGFHVDFSDAIVLQPTMAEATRSDLPKEVRYDAAFHVSAHIEREGPLFESIIIFLNGIRPPDAFLSDVERIAHSRNENGTFTFRAYGSPDAIPDGWFRTISFLERSKKRLREVFDLRRLKDEFPAFQASMKKSGHSVSGKFIHYSTTSKTSREAAQIIEDDMGGVERFMAPISFRESITSKEIYVGPGVSSSEILPHEAHQIPPDHLALIPDRDGDMLAIRDIGGKVIEPNELALIFAHYLYNQGEKGAIVRTEPTWTALKLLAERYGIDSYETGVGTPRITAIGSPMLTLNSSGHITFKYKGQIFADSALAQALLALEIMISKKTTLSQYLEQIYKELHPPVWTRSPVSRETLLESGQPVSRIPFHEFKENHLALQERAREYGKNILIAMNLSETKVKISTDTQDKNGIKIAFEQPDGSVMWVITRNSTTEDLIRIYAEAPTAALQEKLVDATLHVLSAMAGDKQEVARLESDLRPLVASGKSAVLRLADGRVIEGRVVEMNDDVAIMENARFPEGDFEPVEGRVYVPQSRKPTHVRGLPGTMLVDDYLTSIAPAESKMIREAHFSVESNFNVQENGFLDNTNQALNQLNDALRNVDHKNDATFARLLEITDLMISIMRADSNKEVLRILGVRQIVDRPSELIRLAQEGVALLDRLPAGFDLRQQFQEVLDAQTRLKRLRDIPLLSADGIVRTEVFQTEKNELDALVQERFGQKEADLIVLGAGPAGIAAALYATLLGEKVVLLDAGYAAQSFSDQFMQAIHWMVSNTDRSSLLRMQVPRLNDEMDFQENLPLFRLLGELARSQMTHLTGHAFRGEPFGVKTLTGRAALTTASARNEIYQHFIAVLHYIAQRAVVQEQSPVTQIRKENGKYVVKTRDGYEFTAKDLHIATGRIGTLAENARTSEYLEKAAGSYVHLKDRSSFESQKNVNAISQILKSSAEGGTASAQVILADPLLGHPDMKSLVRNLHHVPDGEPAVVAIIGDGESAGKAAIEVINLNPNARVELFVKKPLTAHGSFVAGDNYARKQLERSMKSPDRMDFFYKPPVTTTYPVMDPPTYDRVHELEREGRLHIHVLNNKYFDEQTVELEQSVRASDGQLVTRILTKLDNTGHVVINQPWSNLRLTSQTPFVPLDLSKYTRLDDGRYLLAEVSGPIITAMGYSAFPIGENEMVKLLQAENILPEKVSTVAADDHLTVGEAGDVNNPSFSGLGMRVAAFEAAIASHAVRGLENAVRRRVQGAKESVLPFSDRHAVFRLETGDDRFTRAEQELFSLFLKIVRHPDYQKIMGNSAGAYEVYRYEEETIKSEGVPQIALNPVVTSSDLAKQAYIDRALQKEIALEIIPDMFLHLKDLPAFLSELKNAMKDIDVSDDFSGAVSHLEEFQSAQSAIHISDAVAYLDWASERISMDKSDYQILFERRSRQKKNLVVDDGEERLRGEPLIEQVLLRMHTHFVFQTVLSPEEIDHMAPIEPRTFELLEALRMLHADKTEKPLGSASTYSAVERSTLVSAGFGVQEGVDGQEDHSRKKLEAYRLLFTNVGALREWLNQETEIPTLFDNEFFHDITQRFVEVYLSDVVNRADKANMKTAGLYLIQRAMKQRISNEDIISVLISIWRKMKRAGILQSDENAQSFFRAVVNFSEEHVRDVIAEDEKLPPAVYENWVRTLEVRALNLLWRTTASAGNKSGESGFGAGPELRFRAIRMASALQPPHVPSVVLVDYQDLKSNFSRDQIEEIFAWAYLERGKVDLAVYNISNFTDPLLKPFFELPKNVYMMADFSPAIAFEKAHRYFKRSNFDGQAFMHISKRAAQVKESVSSRSLPPIYLFRYKSDDAKRGLLTAALLYVQYADQGQVLDGFSSEDGYLILVDEFLRTFSIRMQADLYVAMAA